MGAHQPRRMRVVLMARGPVGWIDELFDHGQLWSADTVHVALHTGPLGNRINEPWIGHREISRPSRPQRFGLPYPTDDYGNNDQAGTGRGGPLAGIYGLSLRDTLNAIDQVLEDE
jgi:hypothetical protein